MTRMRARFNRFVPGVVALFALGIAVPRAGLYYHEHPGGTQAHVHADDGSGIAELLEEYWHEREPGHTHPAHNHDVLTGDDAGQPARSGLAFERDEGPSTGHWHQQDRFHRAIVAAPPFVPSVSAAGLPSQRPPAIATHRAARDLRARGPPRSLRA